MLQEIFVKLARQPGLLRGVREERAFLIRLAHNAAIDLMRRRSTRERTREQFVAEDVWPFAPTTDPDELAFRDALSGALAELPPEQRAVVHLKLWDGLTFEQIAERARNSAKHRRQSVSLWHRQIARLVASTLRRNQMNTDDFEQRLQRQPLRQVPSEWREEILSAANEVGTARRDVCGRCGAASLPGLREWLLAVLWPNPKAWAGLAAIWIVILAVNFSLRDKSSSVCGKIHAALAGSHHGITSTGAFVGGIDGSP